MPRSATTVSRVLTLGIGTAAVLACAISLSTPSVASTASQSGQALKTHATRSAKLAEARRLGTDHRTTAFAGARIARTAVGRLAANAQASEGTTTDPTPPPTTMPQITTSGTSGIVRLSASTTAPYVLIKVDAAPVDGQASAVPVKAEGGLAAATYTSWGTANGLTHRVTAADCSTIDVNSCSLTTTGTTFTVTNTAPRITSPSAGSSITGGFVVRATSQGGGVRFLIDGRVRGFDGSFPYSLTYTGSALASGRHTIQVVQCSTNGTQCSGPASSISITSASLHPTIVTVSPRVFSPNADRYKDSTDVTYTLPDTETTTITVSNSHHTMVRTSKLGAQRGRHVWTWNGRSNFNKVVPSGSYTVTLSTSAVRHGATVRGSVSTRVSVDLHAPSLSSLTYGSSVYPYRDGYKDAFTVSWSTDETTAATLVILGAHAKVVRKVSAGHTAGVIHLSWNGRDSHGNVAAAGTYGWYLLVHDSVGNARRSPTRHVVVSHRRLVTKHSTINTNGDSYFAAGGSDPGCAEASQSLSQYTHGVWLDNACDAYYDDFQIAAAIYHVSLPAATVYTRVSVQVGGFSLLPPTNMSVAYGRDGRSSDYVIGQRYAISNDSEGFWGIGSINPTGLMTSNHVMTLGVDVDDIGGGGDFDLATLRVNVTYQVLN